LLTSAAPNARGSHLDLLSIAASWPVPPQRVALSAAGKYMSMSSPPMIRFETPAPVTIFPSALTPIRLAEPDEGSPNVALSADGVVFRTEGWYEVLLEVHWDAEMRNGTRFSHTKIPDQEPLHSEAINANVLAQLSEGRQLLRGNSLFGPERTSCLVLEVWQDSGRPVEVEKAGLIVRELCVPWPPEPNEGRAQK